MGEQCEENDERVLLQPHQSPAAVELPPLDIELEDPEAKNQARVPPDPVSPVQVALQLAWM